MREVPGAVILLPYKEAIRQLGLSRSGFDRYVRPYVRSTRLGRRLLFGRDELEQFAMDCLSRSVGILAHAWEQMQQGGRNKGPIPRQYLPKYTGKPAVDE